MPGAGARPRPRARLGGLSNNSNMSNMSNTSSSAAVGLGGGFDGESSDGSAGGGGSSDDDEVDGHDRAELRRLHFESLVAMWKKRRKYVVRKIRLDKIRYHIDI